MCCNTDYRDINLKMFLYFIWIKLNYVRNELRYRRCCIESITPRKNVIWKKNPRKSPSLIIWLINSLVFFCFFLKYITFRTIKHRINEYIPENIKTMLCQNINLPIKYQDLYYSSSPHRYIILFTPIPS